MYVLYHAWFWGILWADITGGHWKDTLYESEHTEAWVLGLGYIQVGPPWYFKSTGSLHTGHTIPHQVIRRDPALRSGILMDPVSLLDW